MKKIYWIILPAVVFFAGFMAICELFDSKFANLTIDWFAFFAGIFLVAEGLYKILTSKTATPFNQFLRFIRVAIGTCVFTVHLLQFTRL
ncbi:MAG: hypothetical protein KJ995_02330 [Candidatus Omnitrophica bacterium]|nr:hypothetical protein [Candidatus Omnitrophota bacterium]MBU1128779.1 hypothetical protein [Candidatus Omnitrophota bacterium]MBU1656984.1 hypothetical protein [Candidatus Omnitrophota bacterium]MBU1785220.1 hypothetical protein [Candidatus Omnitrophota bacterium]MBU1851228.1 hypothetical protein [Candidatus Omnitrophota bacterium]